MEPVWGRKRKEDKEENVRSFSFITASQVQPMAAEAGGSDTLLAFLGLPQVQNQPPQAGLNRYQQPAGANGISSIGCLFVLQGELHLQLKTGPEKVEVGNLPGIEVFNPSSCHPR